MGRYRIAVLTGAGVSAESGVRTFRDGNGLWEGHRIEDVATPEAFIRNPSLVHDFYNQRRAQLKDVQPNAAHIALAEFERRTRGEFLLITQNVDDLHTRAGSRNVLHMHGELRKVRCLDSDQVFPWTEELSLLTPHPKGGRPGRLRPHIVWFGEMPFGLDEIERFLSAATLFVAIGTSGVVYPAAGFVSWVPKDCRRVLLNKDEPENVSQFDEVISGPATETVTTFFSGLGV